MIEIVISDPKEVARLRSEFQKQSNEWLWYVVEMQWMEDIQSHIKIRFEPPENATRYTAKNALCKNWKVEDLKPRNVESEVEDAQHDG